MGGKQRVKQELDRELQCGPACGLKCVRPQYACGLWAQLQRAHQHASDWGSGPVLKGFHALGSSMRCGWRVAQSMTDHPVRKLRGG